MTDSKTGKKQSFTGWLRARRTEDTRIGDLARDVKHDSSWPRRATTKATFRRYLEGVGACDAALETLDIAWEYYLQHQPHEMLAVYEEQNDASK